MTARRSPLSLDQVIGGTLLILLLIFGLLMLFLPSGMSGQTVPGYCGGTGVAIVGQWPAFSCTRYDASCHIVVVPCSAAQIAIIRFVGGYQIPPPEPRPASNQPNTRSRSSK
jgi:hypothetical protein